MAQRWYFTRGPCMADFLVFRLAGTRFGVELRHLRQALTLGPITPIPLCPPVWSGAVNVRGRVVPVVDTELLLTGRPGAPQSGGQGLLVARGEAEVVLGISRVEQVMSTDEEPDDPGMAASLRPGLTWTLTAPHGPGGSSLEILSLDRLFDRLSGTMQELGDAIPDDPRPADRAAQHGSDGPSPEVDGNGRIR